MGIQVEDILGAVCSQIEAGSSNAMQKVFLIADAKEAKLAFDILIAHGFNAKIYHDAGKPSKIYISTKVTLSQQQLDDALASAMAYAGLLKHIKEQLDAHCAADVPALHSPEYSVAFVNLQPHGKQIKQILIQVQPTAKMASGSAVFSPTAKPLTAAQPKAVKTVRHKSKTKNEGDEMTSGPAVAKNYPGKLGEEASLENQGPIKKFFTFMRANFAVSGFAMFIMILIAAIAFSIVVFGKAIICPDFASLKRNHAWYCQQNDDSNDHKQTIKLQQP